MDACVLIRLRLTHMSSWTQGRNDYILKKLKVTAASCSSAFAWRVLQMDKYTDHFFLYKIIIILSQYQPTLKV